MKGAHRTEGSGRRGAGTAGGASVGHMRRPYLAFLGAAFNDHRLRNGDTHVMSDSHESLKLARRSEQNVFVGQEQVRVA